MSDGHKCDEENFWGGRCDYHVGSKDTMQATSIGADTPDPCWRDRLERTTGQSKIMNFEGQDYQLIGECQDVNWALLR